MSNRHRRLKDYYRSNVQFFRTNKEGKSVGQGQPGWRTFLADVNFGLYPDARRYANA